MRIAICDDEYAAQETILSLVQCYMDKYLKGEGEVQVFTSGEALIEAEENGERFDVLLMDILMPGQDGIAVGKVLRALGEGGAIIYLSSSRDFAIESYDVRAFYYLLKPVKAEKLFEVLDKVNNEMRQRAMDVFFVQTTEGTRRVLLDKILYVERDVRCMRYVCTDEVITSRTLRVPFREAVASLLQDTRFQLCGASFLLNLEHIAGVDGQNVLFDNGYSVIVPRAAVTELKDAWGQFWLKGGRE